MIEKQISLDNKETIHYYSKGHGNKVLLLIHGNTSSGIFFEPLVEFIPDNIRLLVPDLRGFGKSSYKKKIDSISDLALDLKLFLEELEIERVDVLGWSLGGAVAMELATTFPNMVEHLVLLSSASLRGYPTFKKDASGKPLFPEIYHSKEELATDAVQVVPLLTAYENNNLDYLKTIFDWVIYTGHTKPSEEDNIRWLTETLKQRNLVDVNWALANFNLSETPSFYTEGTDQLHKLLAKTLLIWGDKDLTVPKYMFDENVTHFKNATSLVYEGCGHSIIVDEPKRLASDILEFIQ